MVIKFWGYLYEITRFLHMVSYIKYHCPWMKWHVKGLSKTESEELLGPGPVLHCQTWAFLLTKGGWAYALGPPKPGTLKLAMVAQLSHEPWASLAAWLWGRIWSLDDWACSQSQGWTHCLALWTGIIDYIQNVQMSRILQWEMQAWTGATVQMISAWAPTH